MFKNVETLVLFAKFDGYTPSVVLDNLSLEGVGNTVVEDGGVALLSGGNNVESWAMGHNR